MSRIVDKLKGITNQVSVPTDKLRKQNNERRRWKKPKTCLSR